MKKEKTHMHILPQFVNDGHCHPRKFHFWQDIVPYVEWSVKKELSLDLHDGLNIGKIYKSMRERIASKLDPQIENNRNIKHD